MIIGGEHSRFKNKNKEKVYTPETTWDYNKPVYEEEVFLWADFLTSSASSTIVDIILLNITTQIQLQLDLF